MDAYPDMNDTALVPVVVEPMLYVDRTIELEVSFNTMTDGTNRAMFNQVSYLPPLVPTVLSALTLGPNATDVTPYGPSSFVLDHLSAVQIILKNGDVGNHPLYVQLLSVHCVKVSKAFDSQPSSRPQDADCQSCAGLYFHQSNA